MRQTGSNSIAVMTGRSPVSFGLGELTSDEKGANELVIPQNKSFLPIWIFDSRSSSI